jgi:hypothetical protein
MIRRIWTHRNTELLAATAPFTISTQLATQLSISDLSFFQQQTTLEGNLLSTGFHVSFCYKRYILQRHSKDDNFAGAFSQELACLSSITTSTITTSTITTSTIPASNS